MHIQYQMKDVHVNKKIENSKKKLLNKKIFGIVIHVFILNRVRRIRFSHQKSRILTNSKEN